MIKLTDTQTTLLQLGIADPRGIIDPSRHKGRPAAALSPVLGTLRRKGLAEKADDGTWRITAAGREAVGLPEPACAAALAEESTEPDASPTAARKGTRRAQVLGLLQCQEGASMAEMQAATGWQAHSIRALLSGLRKDGVTIVSGKQPDGTSRYQIAGGQDAS